MSVQCFEKSIAPQRQNAHILGSFSKSRTAALVNRAEFTKDLICAIVTNRDFLVIRVFDKDMHFAAEDEIHGIANIASTKEQRPRLIALGLHLGTEGF